MLSLAKRVRLKKVLNIAIPAALQSVLDLFSMAVSFIFIGQLGSATISALGAAITFFMYIYSVTAIFNVGTNALVSRKVGARDMQSASRILSSMLYSGLFLSIPIFFLALATYTPFLSLMKDVSIEAKQLGEEYLSIIIFIIPFFISKIIIVAAMSAYGDTRTPFIVKLFATCLSVLLNYILIHGHLGFPAMGLIGAGVANIVVNVTETSILVYILCHHRYPLSLIRQYSKEEVIKAMKIGFPSGLERFFTLTSMAIFAFLVTHYGEKAFAGYMVGGRVEAFVFMPCFGFMIAAMSLMGQNLGAKRESEAKRCIEMILFLSMSFMGSLGIILIIAPIPISIPFSNDRETLEFSALYLFYIGFSQLFLAINFVLDGALRGAGVTKVTLLVNSISIWCLRIIPSLIFVIIFHVNLELIYAIMSIETILRSFVYWYLFYKGIWKDSLKKKKKHIF